MVRRTNRGKDRGKARGKARRRTPRDFDFLDGYAFEEGRHRRYDDEVDDLEDDDPRAAGFDLERWRRELTEAHSHRARIRARDQKRGALKNHPADPPAPLDE